VEVDQNPRCPAQDFEGITPNLLARTIETVEGGGIIVMLISTLRSLQQLFTLTMDVHARLKTESHQDVRGPFPHLFELPLQPAMPKQCIRNQHMSSERRLFHSALHKAQGNSDWIVKMDITR
jgi:tRNA(Met) C34 N-acetyltransferase TmcA